MLIALFIYGLANFSLGLAVFLEARRSSRLPLGRQLPWLAAFGFANALIYWIDLFAALQPGLLDFTALAVARTVLQPVSAALLICFGVGLMQNALPRLERWRAWNPAGWLILFGLLPGFALTLGNSVAPNAVFVAAWFHDLLLLAADLLAAAGFLWQRHIIKSSRLGPARNMLLGAGLAFILNGFMPGLALPAESFAAEFLRMSSVITVTFFVVQALGVFEMERKVQLNELHEAHQTVQQAALNAQVEACQTAEDWTNALVSLSRSIADMNGADPVLMRIVEMGRSLLRSDTAVLALWDEGGSRLEVKFHATASGVKTGNSEVITSPIILDPVRACCALRFPDDFRFEGETLTCLILQQEVKTAAIVPLKLENQPFGGLWVGRLKDEPFTTADLTGLERLADQAVIAITHALMASRMQSLAVLEERSRLAREMHDGLAQILGYLHLETQTIEAHIKNGDLAASLVSLKQARQNIDLAQADVRESILSLRTTLAGKAGITSALREFLEEYGVQTGIQVKFTNELEGELNLSPIAETQMVRIVQEALANVRKHAQAQAVQVRLEACGGHLSVTVTDNGVGFELSQERGHFGLQTMQERARSIDGGVTITSQPGAGTQVQLWLPRIENHYGT